MLTALIKILVYYVGKGLVYLGYGKKGYAALKEVEGDPPGWACYVFGVITYVWLFFGWFFYLSFPNSADSYLSLGTIIVCPIIYAIWFIYARCQIPGLLEQAQLKDRLREADKKTAESGGENKPQDPGRVPERQAQPGDWQCTCGRTNPRYITTCACGVSKKDIH